MSDPVKLAGADDTLAGVKAALNVIDPDGRATSPSSFVLCGVELALRLSGPRLREELLDLLDVLEGDPDAVRASRYLHMRWNRRLAA